MGGTRWVLANHPVNLLLLCVRCHAWVESNREQALGEGWLLSLSWGSTTDPADIPLPPRRNVGGVRQAKADVRDRVVDAGRAEPSLRHKDADSTTVLPFQELTND